MRCSRPPCGGRPDARQPPSVRPLGAAEKPTACLSQVSFPHHPAKMRVILLKRKGRIITRNLLGAGNDPECPATPTSSLAPLLFGFPCLPLAKRAYNVGV